MLLTIPGMLDPHVHLRDMEWSHKGTFTSETAAALAGGYFAVLDMPNTPPATISLAALRRKQQAIASQALCDWGLYFGAAATGNYGEYAGVRAEICGLKIYCNHTTGDLLVADQATRDAHYRSWPADKIIAVHAEGATVVEILELVRRHRKRTHFCHISTADEIRHLTAAKAEGLPVTIGVCPHHLYLCSDDTGLLGGLGLMKPELKTRADQAALWAALASGVVDVIESDHAPHTLAEKRSGRPVYGVPGLETTLPLLGLAVHEGRLRAEQIVELCAVAPRRIFGVACPADTYTTLDLAASYVLSRDGLRSACGWSPFEGMRVHGKVREVVVRGRRVFDGEQILIAPGSGQALWGA